MRNTLATSLIASLLLISVGYAAGSADSETVSRLGQTKHSLVQGIRQAAKTNGAPISAKFEFEDGKFWLSVYTAKSGIEPDAEHNTLIELKGEPNAAVWNPNVEIFEDKKHLTRSAMQLTVLQQSKMDLAAAVEKAATTAQGVPYSAIPAIKSGKPVVIVKIAAPDGTSHSVDVAL